MEIIYDEEDDVIDWLISQTDPNDFSFEDEDDAW